MSDKEASESYGTAGLRSSKGEPDIIRLLHELWMKIIELQNARKGEKDDGSDTDSGESLADRQYKLLEIQLDYINKHLRNELNNKVHRPKKQELHNNAEKTEGVNVHYTDNLDMIPVKLEKETQTSKASSSTIVSKEEEKKATQSVQTEDANSRESRNVSVQQPRISQHSEIDGKEESPMSIPPAFEKGIEGGGVLKTCAHSHYHMKLSDVPFLVGKCTTASHSVIANVQNVIGMMKSHNRGLCTPPAEGEKVNTCRNLPKPVEKHSTFQMHDLKVTLKHLTEELSNLTMKQEMLRQKLYGIQQVQGKDVLYKEYNDISQLLEIKAKEIAAAHEKLKKENVPNKKVQKIQQKSVNHRHLVSAGPRNSKNKVHANKVNIRGSTNKRLMQSIKQLKGKLQEEDIVWS